MGKKHIDVIEPVVEFCKQAKTFPSTSTDIIMKVNETLVTVVLVNFIFLSKCSISKFEI